LNIPGYSFQCTSPQEAPYLCGFKVENTFSYNLFSVNFFRSLSHLSNKEEAHKPTTAPYRAGLFGHTGFSQAGTSRYYYLYVSAQACIPTGTTARAGNKSIYMGRQKHIHGAAQLPVRALNIPIRAGKVTHMCRQSHPYVPAMSPIRAGKVTRAAGNVTHAAGNVTHTCRQSHPCGRQCHPCGRQYIVKNSYFSLYILFYKH
jgi:hypothetical protein